ncbi:MAG: arabinose transporter [Proteobacteria bacterium]|nr:arabinose transporter [Pseudomonadota bacterium]
MNQPATRSAVSGLAPLVVIILLSFSSIGAPLPVLSLYVHNELGFDAFTVGLVIGLQSLVTVLTRHWAGGIADRRGPKAAALAGVPLTAIAGIFYLASAWMPGAPMHRLGILLLGRIMLGFGESLFLTGTMTWGIGRIGAARTGRVMAWQGIAIYAAFGLGAPLGLAIYGAQGFAGIGFLTMALPLLALVVVWLLPAVAAPGGDRAPFYKVVGLIWRPGTILMLATVPFGGMAAFLPLDYAAHGWAHAGLAMAAFGVVYTAVRLVGSHWPDTHGPVRMVGISLAIETAGQLLLWLAPQPGIALLGAALTGMGFSLVFPSMGVIATKQVPASQRGRAVGNFVAFDIAVGLTGPVVGLLTGAFGYDVAFLVGAIATIGAGVLLPAVGRMKAE